MNANVFLLALSQALMMTMVGLVLSSSALVAVGLSAPSGLANLPLAAQYLATLLVLHPAAGLMARRGRRWAGRIKIGRRHGHHLRQQQSWRRHDHPRQQRH